MPFLKPLKVSVTESRIDACKKNGLRHAIFTPFLSSKKRYKGEWKDDKKHGKGSEFDLQSRFLYEGDWLNDVKHGYGELSKVLPDGSCRKVYLGHWINGQREGFGGLWYENGGYYEGNFLKDKRHGFGRMWQTDDTFYQGTWKNNLYHGEGMLVLANGNRFEGNFSLGKKEGPGIFYHINTGQLQEGCWLADKCLISTMEDIYWRQSALVPTPNPIPKTELTNPKDILETRVKEVSMLCNPESSSFSAKFSDYARENIDCR